MSSLPAENARLDRLLNAIDNHFTLIVETIAEMGIVKSKSHSVFLIYAHNNTDAGVANAELVKNLIKWLKDAGVNLLSDRSPWDDDRPSQNRSHYNNPGRDILWNQMRLLPKCRYPRGADKVIICCSEVLKAYDDKRNTNPDIFRYYQEIQDAYKHAQNEYMQEQEMYNEIHNVIRRSYGDDFHHVLTELALLAARGRDEHTGEDESQSVIPVILNGEHSKYKRLPFLANPTTISLKFKAEISLLESRYYEHEFFFKLLESLHSDTEFQLIKYFSTAYSNYTKQFIDPLNVLDDETEYLSRRDLSSESKLELRRAVQKVKRDQDRQEENGKVRLKSLKVLTFQRNPIFTGRYPEFGYLFKIFFHKTGDGCPYAALFGLGGIGKTQIAVEFAYRIQERSPEYSIFWVQANDAISFEDSYRKIAKQLQIPLDTDNLNIKARVNERLSRDDGGKWLMVVDSADDPILDIDKGKTIPLIRLLPSSRSGGILFTTRNLSAATDYYAKSNVIMVDQMNEREAMALLKRNFRDARLHLLDDKNMTLKLLEYLCMLPLAIMQAACYLNKTPITILEYLQIFDRRAEEAIELLGKEIPDQDMDLPTKRAVATTWILSFEQIEKTNQLAAKYLRYIATIRDRDIPRDILPDAVYDALTIEQIDALGTLVGFGFLKPQPGERLYSMHRLVHLITRNWLKDQGQLASQMDITISRVSDILPYGSHENYQIWAEYLPHAIHIVSCSKEFVDWEKRDILLDKTGRCQSRLGQYKASEETHRQLLALRETELGDEHPETFTSINNLAQALSGQGKYAEAETIYRETLMLRKKILGNEYFDIFTNINRIALALTDQGKYAEAETMHRETLTLRKKMSGDEHPNTIINMNNLAQILSYQGKYIEAETIYRETLILRKKTLGDEHPNTLTSINRVALALSHQGKYVEVETMYREELILRKKILGDEYPDTLTTMNNLAFAFSDQGKYVEAETIHRETLALSKKVSGDKHPFILTNMNNLAQTLSDQGKYAEAEIMHRETLALRKKVSGDEHPHTLTNINNLAIVLRSQGKYAEAETMHHETLVLRKKVLGDEHPQTLTSMNNFAFTLSDQAKYTEAEMMHRKTLALRKKVLGDEHPYTLISTNNLIGALSHQGKYAEAEMMHRETLILREKVIGNKYPDIFLNMNNLAGALRDQGKYTEAETMYREILTLRKKVIGNKYPDIFISMNRIAFTLSHQGKYAEAETIHYETLILRKKILIDEHPDIFASMNYFAGALSDQGKYAEAKTMHRKTLVLRKKVLGDEYLFMFTSINNLAQTFSDQGKYAEAETMHRETLALRKKVLGDEHLETLTSMNNLISILKSQGKYVQAEILHRRMLALMKDRSQEY